MPCMTTPLQFAEVEADPLRAVLKLCAAAAPAPWYPRAYAALLGVERDSLDPFLDQLRLGGLIRLTEWTADSGQGYALTPAGEQALRDPALLDHLRAGDTLGSVTSTADFDEPSMDGRREPPRETTSVPSTPI